MDDPFSVLAAFDSTNTLGSLLIGGFIAVFLFGLSTVQTYLYYREYPKDHRLLKLMVAFVWICELAHTICITNSIYVAVITFYGQPQKLVKLPPALNLTVAFGAPVTAAVQIFYTDRIRRFIGRQIYIPIFLWFLSGIHMVGSYFLMVVSFKVPSVTEYVADWGWMFTLLFTMGAFLEVAIAIALVANLYTHREHVFNPTLKMLDRLIWWTIRMFSATAMKTNANQCAVQKRVWSLGKEAY
ncbi:hypothetical protein BT96DRAFT_990741 [Gymnopus androsaceus JB14]|uniref:Integral membrane protein n=1 Tax=Gymnopus androsaceus JB14 TaxID=1447944 RepID=A0A6A4HUL2_9AGAR|nr:hypothetical protein BT96DRAFT_990741 [Gymnopus androsaceus JB14]